MSNLEQKFVTALHKALTTLEFKSHGDMWVKPVSGMANAHIVIELPIDHTDFTSGLEIVHLTPIFRFVVDASQISTYVPAEITESLLAFAGRIWGQLWVRRPFDLSDRIPTAIGLKNSASIDTIIERQLLGPLKNFEDHIDLHAWSIPGLLGLALELADGYVPSPLHWKTVMMVLAANGRDARAALSHTAWLLDKYYGADIGTAFQALLDTLPMDRWKLWYLVGSDEEIDSFRIQPSPRPGDIVHARAGWREQGMPARAPSGKKVEPINLNWDPEDIDGWVSDTEHKLHGFLERDVFFTVEIDNLDFHDAMKLECQLLDTFADFAAFSQPENFYLQTMFIRIFGEFYKHRRPDARWMQHPQDVVLHPGIEFADGSVLDLFAMCEFIFDQRTGMVLGDALPLGSR